MSITIFTWDMFRVANFGVGHASMHIHGPAGSAYISFWPAAHTAAAGLHSRGKVHFIRGDKQADGQPSWASRSLTDLNERAIINFWMGFDPSPSLDYQGEQSSNVTKDAEPRDYYNILWSQCSTTVVRALWLGANARLRTKIAFWLAINAGRDIDLPVIGHIKFPYAVRIPTVTPADVRELVCDVWGDSR